MKKIYVLIWVFSSLVKEHVQEAVYSESTEVCISSEDPKGTCKQRHHIVLDSVTFYKIDNCQPGTCCHVPPDAPSFGIIQLPTYQINYQDILKLALKTCHFGDECSFQYIQEFGADKVDSVFYNYRCFPDSRLMSPCIAKVASDFSVPVYYDGTKSLTSSCTCHVTSASRGISLHILYMQAMNCSIKVHDGNCEWFLPCNGTVGFSEGAIMMFDGREIRVSFDSSEALAVEVKGVGGGKIKVECGLAENDQTYSKCPTHSSSVTSTSSPTQRTSISRIRTSGYANTLTEVFPSSSAHIPSSETPTSPIGTRVTMVTTKLTNGGVGLSNSVVSVVSLVVCGVILCL